MLGCIAPAIQSLKGDRLFGGQALDAGSGQAATETDLKTNGVRLVQFSYLPAAVPDHRLQQHLEGMIGVQQDPNDPPTGVRPIEELDAQH